MSNPMKVMKFYADWCQPCKALSRRMESIQEELELPLENVNIEVDSDTAIQFGVRTVPTMILVDEDMQPMKTAIGCSKMTVEEIKEFFSR